MGVVDGGAGLGLVSVLHCDLNEIKRNESIMDKKSLQYTVKPV